MFVKQQYETDGVVYIAYSHVAVICIAILQAHIRPIYIPPPMKVEAAHTTMARIKHN